ncbi:MAG: tetratricopeptide repeat protein [Treponema sp.]|jgi:tetratricopeptide (TPR) repeat protein|nr:tetratricopeptide repeat protein [Treponema sp.]
MSLPRLSALVLVLALVLALVAPGVFPQTAPEPSAEARQGRGSPPDALSEYRQGNFAQAVQICRDEIAENPGNLESHVVICWSLLRLGRYDEVLRYARTAQGLSRYDARVAEILGEVYYYMGNNGVALQYFQEYVNLAPSGQRIEIVYYFIGEIYIRMGKFRHADIALSTAVHYMPGNAAWWTRLAFARENAGDLAQSVVAYEQALSLNPQLSDARRGLDRVRQALGSR